MRKGERYSLELIEENIDLYEEAIEHMAQGESVYIVVDRDTVLNSEEFVSACRKYGTRGFNIIVSTTEAESVFAPQEVQVLIDNFNAAQPYVPNTITFLEGFNLYQAVSASRRVGSWVNEVNSATAFGGLLSPFEKMLYCYEFATQFTYKLEEDNESRYLSRSIPLILDPNNDRICCVGFASLFSALCKQCGIRCEVEEIDYYDTMEGHVACTVYMEDDKYGMHHVFRVDPTFGANEKYGSTFAGIWTGYPTVKNYYKNELSGEPEVMGVAEVRAYEKVLEKTAKEIDIGVNSLEAQQEGFEEENYRNRIQMTISPILEDLIKNANKNVTTMSLDDIKEQFICFLRYEVSCRFREKQSDLARLHVNKSISAKRAQEQFEKINSRFTRKISDGLKITVDRLSALGMQPDEIKKFITQTIQSYELNDYDERLINSETIASQNFLFFQNVKKMSDDVNINALALGARNVVLARGGSVIDACRYSADIIARSVFTEFYTLNKNHMFSSGEVFAQALSLVDISFVDKYLYERVENGKIKQQNETLNEEDKLPLQHDAEQALFNELTAQIYSSLLKISIEEVAQNPSLYENYSVIFTTHPELIEVYESAVQKQALSTGNNLEHNTTQDIVNSEESETTNN